MNGAPALILLGTHLPDAAEVEAEIRRRYGVTAARTAGPERLVIAGARTEVPSARTHLRHATAGRLASAALVHHLPCMATRNKEISELAHETAEAIRRESAALREAAKALRHSAEIFRKSAAALRREADASPDLHEAEVRRNQAELKAQHAKALDDHAFTMNAEADSAQMKADMAEARAVIARAPPGRTEPK
jgi:hypothetical protein